MSRRSRASSFAFVERGLEIDRDLDARLFFQRIDDGAAEREDDRPRETEMGEQQLAERLGPYPAVDEHARGDVAEAEAPEARRDIARGLERDECGPDWNDRVAAARARR